MNIAYACDDNYITHTGISIYSLLINNQSIDKLNIYLISVNISKENIDKIRALVEEFNRLLIVINFKELCPKLKLSDVGRHIETIYAKLFFGNIEGIDKMIYLDSDIIINDSLEEMWDINLDNQYFGLVKTVTKDYCKALGLSKNDPFYNDGVAIVNAKLLREDNMVEKFLDFIAYHKGNPPVLSEGTINVVCKNRIKTIHPKFNFGSAFFMYSNKSLNIISQEKNYYSDNLINEARLNPVVIHYLAGWFKRPWEIGCTHPLKGEYLKYKQRTVWKDIPLTKKELANNLKFLKIISSIFPIQIVQFIINSYRSLK